MTPQNESNDENSAGLFGDLAAMIGSRPEHSVQHRFGDYDLLGKLGEGGMGVVYLARQRGLDRLVALKMPPLALAQNEMAVARFKRETEALSRCEHPNVVKILSTGEEGCVPYYAMEYIEGADLAKVARALSTNDDFDAAVTTASDQVKKERSELFDGLPTLMRRFAEGDATKNSPVAVKRESKSRVRRLAEIFRDAARGLHHLHERGVIHRDISPGNLMVTANDHRVLVMDLGLATLTDASQSLTKDKTAILGKLRYMSPEQLQAGSTALDRRADVYSLGASLYELLTDHPFFDGDSSERLMKQVMFEKPVSPDKAKPGLPKDLALIVSTATEKEVSRRYPTAQDFADDLDRWLNGEAIRARPPTVGYIVKLAINRNKALFVGTIAALAACVAMAVFFTVREREVLKQRLETETKLKNDAITQRQKAEQISTFLKDMLKGVGPSVALGRDTKMLREILDKTVDRLKGIHAQPEVESDLNNTIAGIYQELGDYAKAETMYQQALTLRRSIYGNSSLEVAEVMNNLGYVLCRRGNFPESETMCRKALAMRRELIGYDDLDVASSLHNLAIIIFTRGDWLGAERMFRDALRIRKNLLGNIHPDVAKTLNNLAIIIKLHGNFVEAEAITREVLSLRRALFGNAHPDVALSIYNLAKILRDRGELDAAESACREALSIRRNTLGNEHPDIASSLASLAEILRDRLNLTEAEYSIRESLALRKRLFGVKHQNTAGALELLSAILKDRGDLSGAEVVAQDALAIRKEHLANDNPEIADSYNQLADVLLARGDVAISVANFRACLLIRENLMPEDWRTFNTKSLIGACLLEQKRYAEAEPLLISGYDGMKQRVDKIPVPERKSLVNTAGNLAKLYEETGRTEMAAEWRQKK